MPLGPGKYDDMATWVREQSQAQGGVVLMVLGGNRGSGFSCQADPMVTLTLPKILRQMADTIERDGPAAAAEAIRNETEDPS